uniref:Uncharacterized protein n=1 Tax=Caenorhabditis japonica TaxID=281687 RepID=A0A8R1E6N8_CAEJA
AIGFVIADKLRPLSTEQIAAYMGVECLAEPDGYDEDQEWIHPPLAHFQQLNNNQ